MSLIMSTDNIEKLYKNFGILADAKEKLVEVRGRVGYSGMTTFLVKYNREGSRFTRYYSVRCNSTNV